MMLHKGKKIRHILPIGMQYNINKSKIIEHRIKKKNKEKYN